MTYSIIVPIYNVEKYLKRCIESIINQTYSDIEVLLVNDESKDKSLEICNEYAKKDYRIKVLNKINGGLSDARNYGISKATGQYIIFVDSDDYIEKNTCEMFLKYCNEKNEVIVGNAFVNNKKVSKIENIVMNKVVTGEEYLLQGYKNSKISMAAWLYIYKKDFLEKNKLEFKYGIYHEDEEFTPRALLCAKTVQTTDIFFYNYVVREESITTKKDKRKNAIDLYNSFCELEKIYNDIQNKQLKKYLLNSISDKYLSLYQVGKLYIYGEKYIHRLFILRHAKKTRTKLKAIIYFCSPKLYYFINLTIRKKRK